MFDEYTGLDEYTGAFARYLRTGTVGALSGFCAAGADLSRLRVYRNGFLRACIDALRANYPSVERLAGEERFPALARPYVEAHPPGTASLVEYGEGFTQHVRDTRAMHGLDWLASFAALDRAWTEVYFSDDDGVEAAPPSSVSGKAGAPSSLRGGAPSSLRGGAPSSLRGGVPSSLRGARPGNLRAPSAGVTSVPAADVPSDAGALMNLCGRLSPRVRVVSLEYRVLDVWSRLRQGEPGQQAEIRRMPRQVLIWRSGAEMLYRDLAPPEHAFIAGVAAGRPIGEAAGAALDLDAGFDLVATFASLLHHHMLSFGH